MAQGNRAQKENAIVTEATSFQPSASQGSGGHISQRLSGAVSSAMSRRADTARHAVIERRHRRTERARRAEAAAMAAAEEAQKYSDALGRYEDEKKGRRSSNVQQKQNALPQSFAGKARFGKNIVRSSPRITGKIQMDGCDGGGEEDKVSLFPSPSFLWSKLSFPARITLIVGGFLWMYYMLFARSRLQSSNDEDDEGRDGDTDSATLLSGPDINNQAKAPKRPPPIWHSEVLKTWEKTSKSQREDSQPKNYALASAEKAAKEAGVSLPPAMKETPESLTISNSSSDSKSTKSSVLLPGHKNKMQKESSKDEKSGEADNLPNDGHKVDPDEEETAEKVQKLSDGGSSRGEDNHPPPKHIDASSGSSKGKAKDGPGIKDNRRKVTEMPSPGTETKADPAASATLDAESTPSPTSSDSSKADSSIFTSVTTSVAVIPSNGAASAIEAGQPSSTTATTPPRKVVAASGNIATADPTATDSEGRAVFQNLRPIVPEGEIPVLHWSYDKIMDPATSRQYFILREHDHVATFKPLCLNPVTEKVYTVPSPRVCSGYNRTEGWMLQYCLSTEESYDKESNMKKQEEAGGGAWFAKQEASQNIRWIEGLTILQVMSKDCGNIAHFAGRATMLQHVLDNISAYAAAPFNIENVLIVPSFHIMKRFLYPHNYAFWHKTFFRSIIAPAQYTIGTLGNFMYRMGKEPYDGTPRVQLLHNFSLSGSKLPEEKIICFRRAIVPGYFKDRYFAQDREYPSDKPSLQSELPGTPSIPRDSLRMRERVSALLHNQTSLQPITRKVVYMDRGGERRKISERGKTDVFRAVKRAAEKRGFQFEVVSFENKNFKEQVEIMEDAGIAIGVHGANLVNSMFMPPLSVLIELFPFKFHHRMYEEGGGAGLKYLFYQMSTGAKFRGKVRFKNVEDCIKMNSECKLHYRDAELSMTPEDITAIVSKVGEAIDWWEGVAESLVASPAKTSSSGPRRRWRRRHRWRRTLSNPLRDENQTHA